MFIDNNGDASTNFKLSKYNADIQQFDVIEVFDGESGSLVTCNNTQDIWLRGEEYLQYPLPTPPYHSGRNVPGKPLDIPPCGFEGDCVAESENFYSTYVVPVLLALTVSLLLCLSLGSLAIWKYYKVPVPDQLLYI